MRLIKTKDLHYFIYQKKIINVIDFGFHAGQLENSIRSIYSNKYRMVAFEANPIFKKIKKGKLYNYLIAKESGKTKDFWLDENNSGASSAIFKKKSKKIKVKTISLYDAYKLSHFKTIDLLKIDIEGSEYEILNKSSLNFLKKNTLQIAVEFHAFLNINLEKKTAKIINLFKDNFYIFKFSFFTSGSMLFVNKNFYKLRFYNFFYIYLIKFFLGFKRFMIRKIKNMVI